MSEQDWIKEKDSRYCIYIHTRLDTNAVFYVGVTGQSKMRKRAFNSVSRSVYWKRIYAKTKILVEIPYRNMTKERAFNLEIILISHYGRTVDGGTLCNMSTGGYGGNLGVVVSDVEREKRRERLLGVPRSLEQRKKQGETIKATRKMTQEWKDNLRTSCKKFRHTPEMREHLKKGRKVKRVGQYNIDGTLIAEYASIKDAERLSGVCRQTIRTNIKRKTGVKFIWKLLN